GQRRARAGLHVRNLCRAGHGLDRAVDVRARKREHHARSASRLRQIHRADIRVRIRTAQKRGVMHAGKVEIIDIMAEPLDQPRVLLALEGLADKSGSHGVLPELAAIFSGLRALIFLAAYCTASTMCW